MNTAYPSINPTPRRHDVRITGGNDQSRSVAERLLVEAVARNNWDSSSLLALTCRLKHRLTVPSAFKALIRKFDDLGVGLDVVVRR